MQKVKRINSILEGRKIDYFILLAIEIVAIIREHPHISGPGQYSVGWLPGNHKEYIFETLEKLCIHL